MMKHFKSIFRKSPKDSKIRVLKEGGVYFESLKLLAISDLQLGHEAVLHNRGISVPMEQFPIIIERLESMLKETSATRVLINGDLKHEFSKAAQQEWDEVLKLLDFFKSKKVELILVRGNHDNYIEKILKNHHLKLNDYYCEDGFLFVHGHKSLKEYIGIPEFKTLVIGHVHPAVSIKDDVEIPHKYHCLLKGEFHGKELLVLPSISPLASGTDMVSQNYSHDTLSPILNECDLPDFIPVVIDEKGGVKEFPKIRYL
ncbi:metallophosphoesterase [Candidatus Micrarchaeota archaeon]|nr:metallophosphoesterase [Candidatus Micrarchaeota archaeon]